MPSLRYVIVRFGFCCLLHIVPFMVQTLHVDRSFSAFHASVFLVCYPFFVFFSSLSVTAHRFGRVSCISLLRFKVCRLCSMFFFGFGFCRLLHIVPFRVQNGVRSFRCSFSGWVLPSAVPVGLSCIKIGIGSKIWSPSFVFI